MAWGRSFAEVFDESYARAPIRKATEAQRRLWLLGAEGLRADSKTGAVRLMENEYWTDWMHEIAGKRVIVRFDPADLWEPGIHIYSVAKEYLGHAPVRMAFRNDLNQTGKQISIKPTAMAWTLLWGMLKAAGWEPGRPVSSHPCRVVLLNGEKHSPGGLTLNPSFTDWLMGWPDGWTDASRPVTGLSRWLQRMRGAC